MVTKKVPDHLRERRPWTEDDNDLMRKLWDENVKLADLSIVLRRSYAAVVQHGVILGLPRRPKAKHGWGDRGYVRVPDISPIEGEYLENGVKVTRYPVGWAGGYRPQRSTGAAEKEGIL